MGRPTDWQRIAAQRCVPVAAPPGGLAGRTAGVPRGAPAHASLSATPKRCRAASPQASSAALRVFRFTHRLLVLKNLCLAGDRGGEGCGTDAGWSAARPSPPACSLPPSHADMRRGVSPQQRTAHAQRRDSSGGGRCCRQRWRQLRHSSDNQAAARCTCAMRGGSRSAHSQGDVLKLVLVPVGAHGALTQPAGGRPGGVRQGFVDGGHRAAPRGDLQGAWSAFGMRGSSWGGGREALTSSGRPPCGAPGARPSCRSPPARTPAEQWSAGGGEGLKAWQVRARDGSCAARTSPTLGSAGRPRRRIQSHETSAGSPWT